MQSQIYAMLSPEEQLIVDIFESTFTVGPGDHVPMDSLRAIWKDAKAFTLRQLDAALMALEEEHHQIRVLGFQDTVLVERLWR